MYRSNQGRLKISLSYVLLPISRLVFLGLWCAFILIGLARGRLDSPHKLYLSLYPLLFFYLLAIILSALSRRVVSMGTTFRLIYTAVGLFLLDQVIKFWVTRSLAPGSSQPLLDGWLHLAHKRNLAGSWILQTLGLEQPGWILGLIMLLVGFGVLTSGLLHRYYVYFYRRSFWADIAFCFLTAALASFLVDMLLHGYILDYISLPGLVTADLKDIYIDIGVSALIVETIENPQISFRWKGWQVEWASLKGGLRRLYEFGKSDLRRIK